MEKNIKKYISNIKNIHLLLGDINKDILKLNKKLELLTDVNNVRLDEKAELFKNIIKNKVQIGGDGVSENLKMNDELDLKIKNLQEKVANIRKKTADLQEITGKNIQKTIDNMKSISQLTESVDSIMGNPTDTEKMVNDIKKLSYNEIVDVAENITTKGSNLITKDNVLELGLKSNQRVIDGADENWELNAND